MTTKLVRTDGDTTQLVCHCGCYAFIIFAEAKENPEVPGEYMSAIECSKCHSMFTLKYEDD